MMVRWPLATAFEPARWREMFDELMVAGGQFRRVTAPHCPGVRAGAVVRGGAEDCWWLAEQARHGDPQAMQRLLRTAVWDADEVRDDLRAFVAAQLGTRAGC